MKRQHLSPMKRLAIWEAASGICSLCGLKIQVGERWEVEHRIPLALGGADDSSNMAPAHKGCHSQKTPVDVGRIAKAKRQRLGHLSIRKRSTMPGSRDSKWKRKINGEVVAR